ncbi:ABC transporter permease [Pokkaliibacter sp. MBI-7]|uniref:ABC transporter permease n=1 Tax=Pokkaliibacter sp. MBI-7 TaxID=3040600 RepID=UPI00244C9A19|nr:ABC transporter permease [Pokkaliibacter sp. MBI-7]MDH2431823.1 ABC transporter permease [Pokkaliibacter sp. MBI-7]
MSGSVSLSPRQVAFKYGLLVLLAAMLVLFSSLEPAFASMRNAFIILQSVAIVAILALGVTTTLAVDGFDLSIGATAATAMMTASYVLVVLDGGTAMAILAALAVGVVVGMINGFLTVHMRIPDLLATLGMMFLLLGLQLIPTEGRSIATGMNLADGSVATGRFTAAFLQLGREKVAGVVPVPVIIMAVLALLSWLLLERSRFGRVFYAIGGNRTAAHLAGAAVARYRYLAYVMSGVYAAIGGILLAARVGRGDVSSGNSLLMDAVAAALVGFAVLGAARPNALGSVMGALFVGVLLNGLTMLNAPYYAQDFIKGAVLVLALMFTFGLAQRR